MAAAESNVSILISGMNQKAPGTISAPGTLRRAENVRIDKGQNGALAFRRRNGLVEVGRTTTQTGSRMVSYAGGLLVHQQHGVEGDEGGLQKYVNGRLAPATFPGYTPPGDPVAIARSQVPLFGVSAGTGNTVSTRDVGYYGNISCAIGIGTAGAGAFLVRDSSTGMAITSGAFGVAATKSKIVQLGGVFFIFWKEANAIKAMTVGATYPYTASGTTTVYAAGVLLAATDYDIQAGFDTTHVAILYRSAAGTYVRALLTTAFAVATTVTDAVAANQPDVALCWNDVNMAGASLRYSTLTAASGLKIQTINKVTLAITATYAEPTAIVANVVNMTGGGLVPGSTPFALIESTVVYWGTTHHQVTAYGDGATNTLAPEGGLASRVFSFDGITSYVWTVYNSAQAVGTPSVPQPTLFLMKIHQTMTFAGGGYPVLTATKGVAGPYESFAISSAPADATGARHILGKEALFFESGSGIAVAQYGLVDLGATLGSALLGSPVSIGGVAMFPPHMLYDGGNTWAETRPLGIDIKPEVPRVTDLGGGGFISAGTYSVIVIYKWIDANGQTYRTAESTPIQVTVAGPNSSISIDMYPPSCNYPSTGTIGIEAYRTPLTGGGDTYYKVTPPSFFSNTNFGASFITFTDTANDITLQAGEPFAPFSPTAGQLPPVSPAAMNVIVEHGTRACGIDAEHPEQINCSNEYSPGTSITWTGAIKVIAPEPLYALASMDGHLIGFAKETIYRWSGELPDARGEGPTLPLHQIIPSGVGTDQPRSVVKTDLGILFYSSKRGFHLLDRSLQVNYLGGAVDTASAGQVISGATAHPTYPEVRFTSEGGTTFVFNTYWTKVAGTPIWTTFTGQPCVHSITHNGKWYLLTSDGRLLEEDLTRWQDGSSTSGAFIPGAPWVRAVEVADINFAGINGFSRVKEGTLMSEWLDSEKIKITTTPNHRRTDPTTGLPAADCAPFTYDATDNPDPYVVTWKPAVQKVTSLTVLIQDTADFQGAGAEWQALSFLVAMKSGSFRQGVKKGMSGGQRR